MSAGTGPRFSRSTRASGATIWIGRSTTGICKAPSLLSPNPDPNLNQNPDPNPTPGPVPNPSPYPYPYLCPITLTLPMTLALTPILTTTAPRT